MYTLRDGRRARQLRVARGGVGGDGGGVEHVLLDDFGSLIVGCGAQLRVFTVNGDHVWSTDAAAGASPTAGRQISALRLSPGGETLLCGFDDGLCTAWSLHGRTALFHFAAAPSKISCIAANESHVLIGTSCSRLLLYPWPQGSEKVIEPAS